MGLAASQCRMLMLVARKSDLEYRGQMINNRRMMIAWQTAALAEKYTKALNNRTFKIDVPSTSGGAPIKGNMNSARLEEVGYKVAYKDASGNQQIYTSSAAKEVRDTYLEAKLREGSFYLVSKEGDTEVKDWRSQVESVQDTLYTEDDESAAADYEAKSAQLQAMDKQLEIELKNVDTQHQAVQTEIDAVKKVIDKNIEMSFKTFG